MVDSLRPMGNRTSSHCLVKAESQLNLAVIHTWRYMQSAEFANDIRNFTVSDIVGVDRRFSYLQQVLRSSDGRKKTNEYGNKLSYADFAKEFAALLVHCRDTGSYHPHRHQLHTQSGWGLNCLRHSDPRPRRLSFYVG